LKLSLSSASLSRFVMLVVVVLDLDGYGVGVCLARKLSLVSQEGCYVAFLSLQSFNL